MNETPHSASGGSPSPTTDPEGREIEALRLVGETGEARTLEIGSGDGRLVRRLRALTSPVTGIDRCLESIANGATESPERWRVAAADACSLPFSDQSFDQIVFGWSL